MHYDYDLIGRTEKLFVRDMLRYEREIQQIISRSKILVLGAGGAIGRAVCRELFKKSPLLLHAVDLSENNLAELVRDLRSSIGGTNVEFRTFCIDIGSLEFESFSMQCPEYDYIFNMSAMKHVRSEKDPYSLMRMIDVNVLNTIKSVNLLNHKSLKKYFCISTDKATTPINMMGASKRIMELFLYSFQDTVNISTARFANVAFSDGSLLDSFRQRLQSRQPISAPIDVRRYFLTDTEAAELCLFSVFLGASQDIFMPKLSSKIQATSFKEICEKFLQASGYEPYVCQSEDEARNFVICDKSKMWPCYFFNSDTTGEKEIEAFFCEGDMVNHSKYDDISIMKINSQADQAKLMKFIEQLEKIREKKNWSKSQLVKLFRDLLDDFDHEELNKDLDQKM